MNTSHAPLISKRSRIWVIVIILLLAAVAAVLLPLVLMRNSLQQSAHAYGSDGTGPQSFAVGTNALLDIKEQSGNISVYPSHTNAITITPRNHGTLVAPDPRNVRILYTHSSTAQGNDQLTITTDPWASNTDFFVTIPATTAIHITLNSGSIDVHAGHGLAASTGSGEVNFESIQGPVNVHTDSGDVTGNTITGAVAITASSGSIKLQQITGELRAKTWSGDVIVHASTLSGASLLQTVNGSVRFDGTLDPHSSSTMQTTNGDVDLSLPARMAFSLEASTGSGSIQNAFGTSSVGSEPRAALVLHTQNGSVAVIKTA